MAAVAQTFIYIEDIVVTAPLRIAVVGAGTMGRHHAVAIKRMSEQAKLVAVVDSDTSRARTVAESLDLRSWYPSIEMMLAAEAPDVVHVCTPPAGHVPAALAAIAGGAHVYLEKPFTETLADAKTIYAAADAAGRRVCAGHQLLAAKPTVRAEAMLERIGTLHHVEAYYAFRPARPANGNPPRTPIAQLLDILPHPTYLLLRLMGATGADAPFGIDALKTDERGDVFATLSYREVTGLLTVTLRGRPADSWVRVVGTRGTLHLDYNRELVLASLGIGSAIDKIVDPYHRAMVLMLGTTAGLARRVLKRQRSYPSLAEMFERFYSHIQQGTPAPVGRDEVLRTVDICEQVARSLPSPVATVVSVPQSAPNVVVTGGTGLLGRGVVRALVRRGQTPLVLARRIPVPREQIVGAHYEVADLGSDQPVRLPAGVSAVIHCAAETVGGWDAHQRNSIGATRALLDGMRASGIGRLVYVSSLAVIDSSARQPLSEASPLEGDGRRRGPYVWGKLEAERIAANAKETHGISVRVARPGPLIAAGAYEPPGKLGRAIAGSYVAVGSPRSTIPVCDVDMAGELLAWMATHFEDAPELINIVDAAPPTRRELVGLLRASRPGIRVLWIPAPVLGLLSVGATIAQKMLRPSKPAVSVWSAFASPRCETREVKQAVQSMRKSERAAAAAGPLP